jgi:pimeloyl-ACP methyl ester carboxylesterase
LELALTLLALLVLIALAGALYQWTGIRKDERRFPPPSRLIDIGGCRLHLDLKGEGSPPVVFEAGIGATSLSWRLVQPAVAKLTRALSYDRAWLGWSDASPQARSLQQLVDELHTLLDRARVAGPKILVAHSYGAWVALAYLSQYTTEVAGLVLVDPVPSSEWSEPSQRDRNMLHRGIQLSRRGGWLAHFGIVRLALSLLTGGQRVLPKLIGRVSSSGGGSVFLERIVGEVGKLPREVWPMVQAHWSNPKCFEGLARYLESLPECAAAAAARIEELAAEGRVLPVPLIVLSAADASPEQRAEQQRLAETLKGRLEIVPGSGHWLQMDRPDAVIRAVEEIMAEARSRASQP